MKKLLPTIVALAAIIGGTWGVFTIFATYAYVDDSNSKMVADREKADEMILAQVAMVSNNQKLESVNQAIRATTLMIWQYQDKYGHTNEATFYDKMDRVNCANLKRQLDALNKKRDELLKKVSK